MPLPLYLSEIAGTTVSLSQHTLFADEECLREAPDLDAANQPPGCAGGTSYGRACDAEPGAPCPEPDPDAALGFIRQVFPDKDWPGHLLIWTLDRNTSEKTSHWFHSADDAKRGILAEVDSWKSLEVYFGMGMSGPGLRTGNGPGDLSPRRRLLKGPIVDNKTGLTLPTPSVHVIPGVWADIDYGVDGHKTGNSKQYAPDMQVVKERLGQLQLPPTIVVHSGHGLQVFWLFDQLVDITENRKAAAARQAGWIDLLRGVFRPYALDSVIDLARVMRLPGFTNNKVNDHPVPVTVIYDDGPRTTPHAVDEAISSRSRSHGGRKGRKASFDNEEPFSFDPDSDRFQASYDNSVGFAGAWDGDRPDLTDQSPSGYDMALANAAAGMGWTAEEIVHLLVARRKKAGAKTKPITYYERTVQKAFVGKQPGETSSGFKRQANSGKRDGRTPSSQKADDFAAVQKYIQEVVGEGKTIYWLKEFYQIQKGIWRSQSEEYFERELRSAIAEVRHSGRHPVISREAIASCMQTLKNAVTPPCIDTALLPIKERLGNYDLDTGEILPGSAFDNGILILMDNGDFRLLERQSRHFFSTARPYSFPENRPPRPEIFDSWLVDRLPDQDTRTAFWEVLGATVSQELHKEQRIIATVGVGRSGKGTALRTASLLVGSHHTAAYTGGPARMAKSQFSLSELYGAALITLPNMPPAPLREGIRRDHFQEGLACLMSISGGDPITIEKKNKDPITANVAASIWIDSNYSLPGFVQEEDDAVAWEERIIPIPFLKTIPDEQRENNFERKFIPELGQIAFFAVEAFAEAKAQRSFTWSNEMMVERIRLLEGKHGPFEKFLQQLHYDEGARILRTEVHGVAERFIGAKINKKRKDALYEYCRQIPGVEESKVNGTFWFKNLGVKGMSSS